MKKLHSNKKPILLGVGLLTGIIIILILFTACDIGLGAIVNTEKPVINSAGNNRPGTFLQGTDNKIELDVSNKLGFKIVEVWMDIVYDAKDGPPDQQKRIYAEQDQETGKWFINLDTTDMADGRITGTVTAKDETGSTTTTTEMIYNVKNTPPQIKLNMPLIDGDNWDNPIKENGKGYLDDLQNEDPLYLGFELLGLATDDYGIKKGYPQIMIWPANGPTDLDDDDIPKPNDKNPYGRWFSLEVPNKKDGLTATKFSWPMTNMKLDSSAPEGWSLDSESLNEGIYRVRFRVEDLFGNVNYYPDRTDNKLGPNGQAINREDIPKKYFEINYKTSDRPTIQITNAPQYYNGVGNLELYLTVSSISKVTSLEAWITDGQDGLENKEIGGSSPYPFSNFTLESEYNSVYKYKLTITPAEAAVWQTNIDKISNKDSPAKKGFVYVRLRATAGSKVGLFAYQNLTFDNKPPEVTIDRPSTLLNKVADDKITGGTYKILYPDNAKPRWVTGAITIGGTVKDNFTLEKVYYHIGKLGDDNSLADREAIYANAANWEDTKLDFDTPADGWEGAITSWTYSFAPFKNEYKESPEGILASQEISDLYNFPSNDRNRTEGKERFYLPFYVKVVDSAGNFSVVHYKLSIDPLLDEPTITITQPQILKYDTNNKPIPPIVGGTVRISGFAEDNFWMHTVLVRVKKLGGYPTDTKLDGDYYIPYTTPETNLFYPSNSSYPKPQGDDTQGWFKAGTIGDSNNINWYTNINQDRALDPLSGSTVDVTVEVIAIDCDESDPTHEKFHITGPIETLNLQFSKDVPEISKPVISKTGGIADRDYEEGIKTSGKFTVSFNVDAIDNINTLTVRANGELVTLVSVTEKQSVSSAWTISDTSLISGKERREITATFDTINSKIPGFSSISGFPIGSTGNLTLEVMAEDATENHLTTTNIFVIGVDNFYPTAVINTPHIAYDNLTPGKEKYYFIEGEAKDYGASATTVQGLERVLVLFERGKISRSGDARTVDGSGTYVNPYTGNDFTGPDIGLNFQEYPNVIDYSAGATTPSKWDKYPVISNSTGVWKSNSALVIDNNEGAAPTADDDGDGTFGETWTTPPALKNFGARVKFSGSSWKDGPYIIHYLIVDQAGNASHYKHDIYLENNKPRITSINFGTDINGVGGITDGIGGSLNEYLYYDTDGIAANEEIKEPTVSSPSGEMSVPFKIRGKVFNVRLEVEKGNNNKNATVSYASASTSVSASTMKKGNVYTIENLGSTMTDFTKYGAPNNVPGTTFVAAGPATTGTGTVISYTLINKSSHEMASSVTSGTISFTNFTNVPDSVKNSEGDIEKPNNRLFIVKVYDTTLTTANGNIDPELDQLADAILVKLDIDNEDSKSPSINVLPFGEEYYINSADTPPLNNPANDAAKKIQDIPSSEYNKNIGMNGNVKGGYVQYAKHSTPATANISGKVKFLGKAEDNHKIAGIYVTISNYTGGTGVGTQFQIARANTSTGNLEPVTPDANFTGQWEFKVLDNKNYFTQDFGHTLNWEFMWDSSKVNNTVAAPGTSANPAQSNVTVTFQIHDAASSVHTANSATTVNVVPYILEVETPLSKAYSASPSAFSRSALGGYPVRENELITIRGFNLGNAIGNAKINGTALPTAAPTGETTTPSINTANGTTTIVSYVPAGATSGELIVTVNNIDSFNNSSNKTKTGDFFGTPYTFTAPYNWEPNGVNNNVLNNSRYIYVWQAGAIDDSAAVATIYNPFMRVTANGTRLLSYGYYPSASNGVLRVRRNNTNIATGTSSQNRMTNTTISVPSAYATGTTASPTVTAVGSAWYAIGSDITAGSYPFRFSRSTNDGTAYDATTNLIAAIGSNSNRFKIPRIAVQSTAGTRANASTDRIFISYYDADSNEINVIYGNAGTNGSVNNIPGTAVKAATDSTANNGSIYTAVGFLSNGLPLLAYYDRIHDSLVFSWGNGTPTSNTYNADGARVNTTQAQWQNSANCVVIDTNKGAHVDMAVDANDNVHLAYFDLNNGGLYYALIPPTSPTQLADRIPNTANVVPVKVDTFLSAGTKIMINVRSDGTRYVPYITYAHASFQGTRNSIRVAWRTDFTNTQPLAGADDNDAFSGKWEVMTVPVSKGVTPQVDEFVCNGVPTSATWTAPGTSGSYLQYNSNLNQTVIVGYMTDKWYEGAILKGNILTVPTPLQK